MARPSTLRFNMAFRVKGVGLPSQVSLGLEFAISAPDPTVYVFDRGDWQPSAQRVWTSSGWFPPVV